ncbi:hypothetical protein EE612_028719 [Oryza sativa]|nr:hypothetical protein EE612_028719 [Oryza sativa]
MMELEKNGNILLRRYEIGKNYWGKELLPRFIMVGTS